MIQKNNLPFEILFYIIKHALDFVIRLELLADTILPVWNVFNSCSLFLRRAFKSNLKSAKSIGFKKSLSV